MTAAQGKKSPLATCFFPDEESLSLFQRGLRSDIKHLGCATGTSFLSVHHHLLTHTQQPLDVSIHPDHGIRFGLNR